MVGAMRAGASCDEVSLPHPSERRDPEAWIPWLAAAFLDRPRRFHHSLGVYGQAQEIAGLLPAGGDVLLLAALLHDVGRALDPENSAPHGFVGARWLERHGLHDVAPLVAHHSGARFEAAARNHDARDRWHDRDPDLLAVLTYLDRTTSPRGERITLDDRRAELCERYGVGSLSVLIFDLVRPEAEHGRAVIAAHAAGGQGLGEAGGRVPHLRATP
jgi:putative nucleotidyltransferase with HDIG domain